MDQNKQELLAKLAKQEKIYRLISKITLVAAVVSYVIMTNREDLPSLPFIIIIVLSVIIGLISSTIPYYISKQYKQLTIEALTEIFQLPLMLEEESYTFDLEEQEEKVIFDSSGIILQDKRYQYDEYEISLSLFCFMKTIYLSLFFTKSDLSDDVEDPEISDLFSIQVTPSVYQAIKQYNLTHDTDSTKHLEYLKNNTEDAVNMLFKKGFMKL